MARHLRDDAVTGNLFTAGTTINIGAASGTTTIRNTALTFNGTTVTMNGVTSLSATAGSTWALGSTFMYISSLGVGTSANPGGGQIFATSNITAYYSDDRLKTRLGNIENALEKLETLTGFYYEANETAQALGYEPVREVGVSAQDVQKILPEIVKPAPIDAKYMTIHYEKLTPLVIEAVKELSAMVRELKAKIDKE